MTLFVKGSSCRWKLKLGKLQPIWAARFAGKPRTGVRDTGSGQTEGCRVGVSSFGCCQRWHSLTLLHEKEEMMKMETRSQTPTFNRSVS